MRRMRVAVWQFEPAPLSPESNLRALEQALASPEAAGVDVFVAPEMFLSGWSAHAFQDARLADPVWAAKVGEIARDRRVWLAASLLSAQGSRRHNTFHLWGPDGRVVALQHKIHLWGREAQTLTPGDEPVAAVTPLAVVGGMVCYDVEFPEVSRALALQGAELLVAPSAFYSPQSWDLMTRARALENGCFLVAANQIGGDPSNPHNGQSRVVDPFGNVLAEVPPRQAGIAVATLDPDRISAARSWAPFLKDLRFAPHNAQQVRH